LAALLSARFDLCRHFRRGARSMLFPILPVVNALAPVVVGITTGWLWARSGRRLDAAGLTQLLTTLGTPCLIFAGLARARLTPEAVATTAVAAILALALIALLGAVALRLLGLSVRTFFASVAFPNAGNLGLPIALFALGDEGFAHAIVFFAFSSIGNFLVGQAVAAGGLGIGALFRMPLVWAACGGILVSLLGIPLPRPLSGSLELLGAMTIPLMLLLLGSSLAQLKLASGGRAAIVAALRFGIGLGVGIVVAWGVSLEGTARATLILQCAMPISLYSYLFAQRFGNAPEEVAGAVLVSTLLAALTVPLVLAVLMG
jgi:malate permease and related proteins